MDIRFQVENELRRKDCVLALVTSPHIPTELGCFVSWTIKKLLTICEWPTFFPYFSLDSTKVVKKNTDKNMRYED